MGYFTCVYTAGVMFVIKYAAQARTLIFLRVPQAFGRSIASPAVPDIDNHRNSRIKDIHTVVDGGTSHVEP